MDFDMKTKKPKTGIFIKQMGEAWHWHLKAKNGKVIAHGRGFDSKRNAIRSIKAVSAYFRDKTRYLFIVYDLNTNKKIWV